MFLKDGVAQVEGEPTLEVSSGAAGRFDEHGVYAGSIATVHGKRVLYFSGRHNGIDRRFYMAIGTAVWDEDDRRWLAAAGPVLSANRDDPWMVSMPDVTKSLDGSYRMSYSSGQWWHPGPPPRSRYGLALRNSVDGFTWERPVDFGPNLTGFFENVASPRYMLWSTTEVLIFSGTSQGGSYVLAYSIRAAGESGWTQPQELRPADGIFPEWCNQTRGYPSLLFDRGKVRVLFSGNRQGTSAIGIAELQFVGEGPCP